MARRAVITGAGVISPLGHDLASFRAGPPAGTPGVRRIQAYDASGLPCPIFGELNPVFDAKKFIPATNKEGRKSLSKMAKTVQMGLCASQLCMDDAGLKKGDISPFRFGIEFGCVMVASDITDLARAAKVSVEGDTVSLEKWGRDGQPEIIPVWLLKFLPNMPACHTSIFFDAQGPNNTITVEDAAGLLALGEAYRPPRTRQRRFLPGRGLRVEGEPGQLFAAQHVHAVHQADRRAGDGGAAVRRLARRHGLRRSCDRHLAWKNSIAPRRAMRRFTWRSSASRPASTAG